MRPANLLPLALFACVTAAQATGPQLPAFPAPPAGDPVTETKFGITTVDPYRRLEDLKDPEVQAWMKAQAARTRTVLDAIPGREALLADIERLSKVTTSRIENGTVLRDGRILLQRKEADADLARLVLVDGIDGGGQRVIVDPEDWRKRTGKPHAINYFLVSPDTRWVAVGISESGSEMASLHLFDLATAKQVEAPITRIWFDVDWLPDSSGFVYNRLNELKDGQPPIERDLNSQAYLHRLGTDADQDPLVFGNRHDPALGIKPEEVPIVMLWEQSDYMLGFPATVDNQVQLFAAPRSQLGQAKVDWRKIVDRQDNVRWFDVNDNDLIVMTSTSPDRAIERISLKDGTRSVVVPPTPGRAVDYLSAREDALYYTLRERSGVGVGLFRQPWDGGSPAGVALPGLQTLYPLGAQEGVSGMLVGGAGWRRFPTVMQVDAQGAVSETGLQPQPGGVDASRLEATVVEVASHDGTLVPLSIIQRTGTPLDGNNPTLLQGYGAYGYSTDPYFAPEFLAYFDRGVVRAFCHVRGGGEKSEAWYRAGFQANKANTWKDFNACAQYLVDKGYTSPEKLGAMGTSAGGILIGNAMVERPDLYRVIFPDVGWTDALGSAQRDPNGPANWPEFGNPDEEAGYRALHAMSSYQKIKDGTAYPAVMALHGVQDPRVVVWNSTKFTSRVNEASSSDLPVLLRLDYEAGHGFGSTQSQSNAERADLISFMLWQFGADGFQPVLAGPQESPVDATAAQ
jgi:prolyl oligopeptidase